MKTLCLRVSRLTGNLVGLQFKGEFDNETISNVLRILHANMEDSKSSDRFGDRLANVTYALKANGIICEAITEN